jgi:hypothetical protein
VEKLWENLKKLELELKTSEQDQWTNLTKTMIEILMNDTEVEQNALENKDRNSTTGL